MKTIIIGIAGGTGSGKSTFTRKLKKEFKEDVAVLYHDNYYRDQSDIPLEERRKTNYDHPDAMETELLIRQLMDLKSRKGSRLSGIRLYTAYKIGSGCEGGTEKSNSSGRDSCSGR